MRRFSLSIALVMATTLLIAERPVEAATSGDFVYVKVKETVGAGDPAIATALCPPGTRTTGAGGSINKANGLNAWLTGIAPFDLSADADFDGDDGGNVEGWNASTKTKSITAYVICSRGSDASDQTYKRADFFLSSGSSAGGSSVSCLGASQEVLGGGAGTTANPYDRLALAAPHVDHFSYGLRGTNPSDRTFIGVAVCLPEANRDVTIVTKTVGVKALSLGSAKVFCPRGTRVTGGGVGEGSLRQIISSRPIDGTDGDKVPDDGWAMKVRNPDDDQKRDSTVSAVCTGPLLV